MKVNVDFNGTVKLSFLLEFIKESLKFLEMTIGQSDDETLDEFWGMQVVRAKGFLELSPDVDIVFSAIIQGETGLLVVEKSDLDLVKNEKELSSIRNFLNILKPRYLLFLRDPELDLAGELPVDEDLFQMFLEAVNAKK